MNEKIAVPHYFEEYKGEKKKKKSEGGAEVGKKGEIVYISMFPFFFYLFDH